jgi:hypothetical protein|tara:strand:+ start:7284 stop:7520 length:237 start_codon:yes stop_codon:yes gene_type:complete
MVTDHVAVRLNKTLSLKQAVGLAIVSVIVALWASSQLNPCRLGEENLALRKEAQFQEEMNIVLTEALLEIGDRIGPVQ